MVGLRVVGVIVALPACSAALNFEVCHQRVHLAGAWMDRNLSLILVASTLNESLKQAPTTTLDLGRLAAHLTLLTSSYTTAFEVAGQPLGQEGIVRLVRETKLNDFVTIDGDQLVVNAGTFATGLPPLVASAVMEYLKSLEKDINDLGNPAADKATEAMPIEEADPDFEEKKEEQVETPPIHDTTEPSQEDGSSSPERKAASSPQSDQEDDSRLTRSKRDSSKRSSSPSSTQLHKRFQHIAVNLVNSIQAHRFSSPFLQPVNPKDAPDYIEVIRQPKDLKTILKSIKLKLDHPEYLLLEQLERDIMLMFANCIMFNKSDTNLVELTKSMKNDVDNIFKLFKEAELDTRT